MKVVGLITEYNPFHNGHAYHIRQALEKTDADYCVVIMSGNYVQRGEPACMDKYLRTDIALRSGADVVIELPVPFATGSAEYFAAGAVSILDKLGVVDFLCFGSESTDIALMKKIAAVFTKEPSAFSVLLKKFLATGYSYPAARSQALLDYLSQESLTEELIDQVGSLIAAPNNILGIEYIKALMRRCSSIEPVVIRRTTDYLSKAISAPYCSSSAIRHVLQTRSIGASFALTQGLKTIRSCVPEEAYSVMADNFGSRLPILLDDFSSILLYKLMSCGGTDLTDYLDISPDLENRIKNCLTEITSFSGFIDAVKCRQYTRTRISRALLHVLLDIKVTDIARYKANDYVPYARVLGFKRTAGPLLKAIKKNSSIPMVTKMADAENHLTNLGADMLAQEVFASNLYQSVVFHKYSCRTKNEYTRGVLIEP